MDVFDFINAKTRSYSVKGYKGIDLQFVYDKEYVLVVQHSVVDGLPPRMTPTNRNAVKDAFKRAKLDGLYVTPNTAPKNKELRAIFVGRTSNLKLVYVDSLVDYLKTLDNPVAKAMVKTIKSSLPKLAKQQAKLTHAPVLKVSLTKHTQKEPTKRANSLKEANETIKQLKSEIQSHIQMTNIYKAKFDEADKENDTLNKQLEQARDDMDKIELYKKRIKELNSSNVDLAEWNHDKFVKLQQYEDMSFRQRLAFAFKGVK